MDGVLGKTISGGGKGTNDKMKSKSNSTDMKKKPVVKQNKKDKK